MTLAYCPVPAHFSDRILCYYINTTSQIQRVCITNIPNWVFERVIFPQQRLFFEAIPAAQLEIHMGSSSSNTLLSCILCLWLQVNEQAVQSNGIIALSAFAHQTD